MPRNGLLMQLTSRIPTVIEVAIFLQRGTVVSLEVCEFRYGQAKRN